MCSTTMNSWIGQVLGRNLVFAAAAMLGVGLMSDTARASSSNSLLGLSRDGQRLATVNRDNGTVTVVDAKSFAVLHEVKVGKKPEGIAFLGDTHTAAVTVYGDDVVAIVDCDAGKVTGKIDVFDEPYGVVANKAGTRVYVTLEYPGRVAEIDVADRKVLREFQAGSFPRGIAIASHEKSLFVTEYFTGHLLVLSLSDGKITRRAAGSDTENLARQVAVHPTRAKAYIPLIRSRVGLHQGEGSVVPVLAVVDLPESVTGSTADASTRRKLITLDSFVGTFVTANPWECAISPDGKHFGVVFAGTDDMYLCDVLDDDYVEVKNRRIIKLGHNPRSVVFTSDSGTFFVYNTLDFEVAAFDSKTGTLKKKIKVCENPLGEEVLLGKILFYSALEPVVGRRWISCASCHPDGDGDGRTWKNPEGLRNTTALYGMAWTHPLHWSADRDEVQDFEHTIRGPLMQGKGLAKGPIPAALGKPLKGMSNTLDAMSAYSNAHGVPLSPHAKGGLSESAQRGKKLFFSAETGCASCHSGPYYTDSTPAKPFKLHDVGTGNDDPSEKMGPKYDTPTLLGIYRTAPYLHHGTAATLEDVLTTQNKGDKHGKTSQLSKGDVADLVEFLKSLPYEDPEPAAKAKGLVKIER